MELFLAKGTAGAKTAGGGVDARSSLPLCVPQPFALSLFALTSPTDPTPAWNSQGGMTYGDEFGKNGVSGPSACCFMSATDFFLLDAEIPGGALFSQLHKGDKQSRTDRLQNLQLTNKFKQQIRGSNKFRTRKEGETGR